MKKIAWISLLYSLLGLSCVSFALYFIVIGWSSLLEKSGNIIFGTIPLFILGIFGLLLSIKSIRGIHRIQRGLEHRKDFLDKATKIFGDLALVGVFLYLIPIFLVLLIAMAYIFN